MIFTLVNTVREPSESLAHKNISPRVADTSREIYFSRFAGSPHCLVKPLPEAVVYSYLIDGREVETVTFLMCRKRSILRQPQKGF